MADDPEGARLHGGRWSYPGFAVLYCAQSLSLAALEILANSLRLPQNMVGVEIDIPEHIGIKLVDFSMLPSGWDGSPPSAASMDVGTKWIKEGLTAVLQVPSAVNQREWNYLLNPAHRDFAGMRFL